jgi:hypothetical protein
VGLSGITGTRERPKFNNSAPQAHWLSGKDPT